MAWKGNILQYKVEYPAYNTYWVRNPNKCLGKKQTNIHILHYHHQVRTSPIVGEALRSESFDLTLMLCILLLSLYFNFLDKYLLRKFLKCLILVLVKIYVTLRNNRI